MRNLKGIYVALLTPYDKNGKINENSIRKNISMNIAKGVDGFYVCGSTGESFLLSSQERKRILEIVTNEVDGRVNVICHAGAIGTDISIRLGRHAVQHGANAISSIPPIYYKFSSREIIQYYADLANELDIPIIPYNFPAMSGVVLDAYLISVLRKIPKIIGIKHTSMDLFQLQQMKKNDPDLIVYNGHDEVYLASLIMGADGAIGSTFNFMSEKFINIHNLFIKGDFVSARKIQDDVNDVIAALCKTGKLYNCAKYIMELMGIPYGSCRRPFAPLTSEDKRICKIIYEKYL